MILQYGYTVCCGVPKCTTVPIPALPVLETPWVFPYPCLTLSLSAHAVLICACPHPCSFVYTQTVLICAFAHPCLYMPVLHSFMPAPVCLCHTRLYMPALVLSCLICACTHSHVPVLHLFAHPCNHCHLYVPALGLLCFCLLVCVCPHLPLCELTVTDLVCTGLLCPLSP
jgi:hypothetical protein